MSRQAKPYPYRGWFVTKSGGQYTRLCRVEEGMAAAQEALDRLKVQRHDNGGRAFPNLTCIELAALFLQKVEVEAHSGTFAYYQARLPRWVEFCGDKPAKSLRLTDGIAYKKYLRDLTSDRTKRPLTPCTINHSLRAAKTALNYGVEAELLPKNPWKKIKLLPEDGRTRVATSDEFQALLRHSSDALFKQMLLVLRWTGARPGEIRVLKWNMVNWDTHCLVIPAKKSKTGNTAKIRKPRIIPIPPVVERLLRWRQVRANGCEFVFPARSGRMWSNDSLAQRFSATRERAGIVEKDGEMLFLYSARHTRLSELAPHASAAVLQQVAGHSTFAMTQRYLHMANQEVYNAVVEADRKRRQPK